LFLEAEGFEEAPFHHGEGRVYELAEGGEQFGRDGVEGVVQDYRVEVDGGGKREVFGGGGHADCHCFVLLYPFLPLL